MGLYTALKERQAQITQQGQGAKAPGLYQQYKQAMSMDQSTMPMAAPMKLDSLTPTAAIKLPTFSEMNKVESAKAGPVPYTGQPISLINPSVLASAKEKERSIAIGYTTAPFTQAEKDQLKIESQKDGKNMREGFTDIAKGAPAAFAEGTLRTMTNIGNLADMIEEVNPLSSGKLFGISTYGKEKRDRIRAKTEADISGIREQLDVPETKDMSKLGKLAYGAVSSTPQMLAGLPTFLASATGGYADKAEQDGASVGKSLLYGTASGLTEAALESVLGVIPGMKGLKEAAEGGLKGLVKNVLGEAVEEGITEPITNSFEKVIYNPSAVIVKWDQIGESAASGALMALMFSALGMPAASRSRAKAEQIMSEGKPMTVDQGKQLESDLNADIVENSVESNKQKLKEFFEGAPVVKLRGDEFTKNDQSLVDRVGNYFQKYYKGVVVNPEIGNVYLTKSGVSDSIAHGLGRTKSTAFTSVPHVLKYGKVISYEKNWKGRSYDTYIIAAPVEIGGEQYIEAVVVFKNSETSRFYLHEVELKKRLEMPFKTGTSVQDISTPGGIRSSLFSVLPDIMSVKASEAPANSQIIGMNVATTAADNGVNAVKSASPLDQLKSELYTEKYGIIRLEDYMEGKVALPKEPEQLMKVLDQIEEAKKTGVKMDLQFFAQKVQEELERSWTEQHQYVKELRKERDQVKNWADLSDDEMEVFELLRKGLISEQRIPAGMQKDKILGLLEAQIQLDKGKEKLEAFNTNRKVALMNQMQELIKNSSKWKDKPIGFQYMRETMERNMIDIAGKEEGQRVNAEIFTPVHENEARGNRWLEKIRKPIRDLKLSHQESVQTQMVGEGLLNLHDVPAESRAKVKKAVEVFRKTYDSIIELANDVLINNGYSPIQKLKNYFPHFEKKTDPMHKALKALGIDIDKIDLPTDISGITHNMTPGKKWWGNLLHRTGNKTTYDALAGFDLYLPLAKDVIFHTYDIQRLRMFENAIRTEYSTAEIQRKVTEIMKDKTIDYGTRLDMMDSLLENSTGQLSNFVVNLRSYTDTLAGKQHIADRYIEHATGRKVYNFLKNYETRVARNMVAINPASWLTNFIAMVTGGSRVKSSDLLAGLKDTMAAYVVDDKFAKRSAFLTNRRGSKSVTSNFWEKVTDVGSAPMLAIDDITANLLVRSKHAEGIRSGLPEKVAMQQADSFAASVMADRSKGSMPTIFNSKNFLLKTFTMFQVEVNNQFSNIFKDLPKEARDNGIKWFALTLFKLLLGSFIYNELYEQVIPGRRPAFDPLGVILQAIKDKDDPDKMKRNMADNVLGQVPFLGPTLSNLAGTGAGGRYPVQAAIPDAQTTFGAVGDLFDPEADKAQAWKTLGKEMLKPAAYFLPPVGGGQIKKTVEGLMAYSDGYSSTTSGDMRYPIPQDPEHFIRTGLFGQYATENAKEYFEEGRRPLSDKQTKLVQESDDPMTTYTKIYIQREIDSIKKKIDEVYKSDRPADEKDIMAAKYKQEIQELNDKYESLP